MSDQPLQLVVVLASGRQVFDLDLATARTLLADTAPPADGAQGADTATQAGDRADLQEQLVRHFAAGLHMRGRHARTEGDPDLDTMLHVSDGDGGRWVIPARNILAIGVVDPSAPAESARAVTFGSEERGRGRYANPD